MELANSFEEAVDLAEAMANKLSIFVDGGTTSTVVTEGGVVPSISKFMFDKTNEINGQVSSLLASSIAARDAAVAAKNDAVTAKDSAVVAQGLAQTAAASVAGLVVTDSTAARNIAAGDAGSYVRFTNAAAKTVTFRPESTQALPAGSLFTLRNVGAGSMTLAPGSGVTITPAAGGSLVFTTGKTAQVKRIAADAFEVLF